MSNDSEALEETATEEASEQKPVISTAERLTKLQERILSNTQPEGIPTGFPILDEVLGSGLFAGLYFMGAISSLGKTTLTCQIADQIAARGHDVLIFSLEMSYEELLAKSLSRLTSIVGSDEKALSTRQLLNRVTAGRSTEEEKLIKDAFSVYGEIAKHITIHEGNGDISVKDIRKIVKEHIDETQRTPIVIIDYIQILAPYSSQYSTDKQAIDKTVVELKRLSRDFQLPVLGISSLNRSNYEGGITMAAFKESGGIEYSADVLIGLQFAGVDRTERNEKFDYDTAKQANPREIELKILKNRNGPVGYRINFKYYPKFNYFREDQDNMPNGIEKVAPIAVASKSSLPILEQFAEKFLAEKNKQLSMFTSDSGSTSQRPNPQVPDDDDESVPF